jgi:oligopeptide transport system substrate-binding protein
MVHCILYNRFFLLFAAVIILFVNCLHKTTLVQKGIDEQTLHIGNQVEPQDLDPQIITGVQEFRIVSALFEGLTILDPKDLHPLPGAARTWSVSGDGRTFTFILRKNGKWSNGEPVIASDFVFSFKRMLSPRLGSEYSYMLFCMKNAEACNKGAIKDFSEVGVKALDDTTLIISLAKPTPYFLSLVSHNSWYPVNPKTILKFGSIDERGTRWTRQGNIVGNGPFMLDKWHLMTVIELKKNPFYWDHANVRLNRMCFYPIDNTQTEERAFRTGQLHITTFLPPQKIEWYKARNPGILRLDPYLATYFYLINIHRPPFNDVRVRTAPSMAIDRESIVKNILKGGQLPAWCFTPPNTGGYTCPPQLRFDTTEARRLLAEAGFSATKPFPPFSLLYNTSETHHTIAQAIQEMWKKYLNVKVNLKNQEWKVYLAATHSQDYDIARMGWSGDYNDPNSFLDMWITGGGNNRTGWSNPAYDMLISQASECLDQEKRFALFQKAENILLEQLPIIPIYFNTNDFLADPSVKGWYPNILNYHPYSFVYLEKQSYTKLRSR